jgi:hypothetical protein
MLTNDSDFIADRAAEERAFAGLELPRRHVLLPVLSGWVVCFCGAGWQIFCDGSEPVVTRTCPACQTAVMVDVSKLIAETQKGK